MPLTVRRARRGDIDAIRFVASAAWRDTYAGLLRSETIEGFLERSYSAVRMEQRIASTFVAVDDSEVIAFAGAVQLPTTSTSSRSTRCPSDAVRAPARCC
ncbi:MAG: hypothetical protein L0221_02400 [Chloroflexi bacterium]|nr:hypothetical protein [Chloroflexota bacterium]